MRGVIQKMLEAEAEAKRISQEADAEAERLRGEARRQAQDLAERTRQAARQEADAIVAAAVRDAEREKKDRLAEAQARLQSDVGLDDAVRRQVVDAIVRAAAGQV